MLDSVLPGSTFSGAWKDLSGGWSMRRGWLSLAKQDVKSSFRRTILGPIWISVQQLAFVLGIGVLYSQLFKVDGRDHIPLVAYGVSFWGLFTRLVQGASSVFIDNGVALRSSNLPRSFFVFHLVAREFIVFLYTVGVILLIPIIYGRAPSLLSVLVVPIGMVGMLLLGVGLSLWLGPLSARYRDINVGIASILQIGLFMTPVFWDPKSLADGHWAIRFNPFAWVINVVRTPLLGEKMDWVMFVSLILLVVANSVGGFIAFAKRRLWISYLT